MPVAGTASARESWATVVAVAESNAIARANGACQDRARLIDGAGRRGEPGCLCRPRFISQMATTGVWRQSTLPGRVRLYEFNTVVSPNSRPERP